LLLDRQLEYLSHDGRLRGIESHLTKTACRGPFLRQPHLKRDIGPLQALGHLGGDDFFGNVIAIHENSSQATNARPRDMQ